MTIQQDLEKEESYERFYILWKTDNSDPLPVVMYDILEIAKERAEELSERLKEPIYVLESIAMVTVVTDWVHLR